ncbi:MAG: bacillithiol system redox-active protein YtxJ [Bacteroidota bacterium]
MGVFGNLFGGKSNLTKKEGTVLPWIPLEQQEQLETIVAKSFERPQVIFKHSTTCGISRMVLSMFSDSYQLDNDTMDLYFLDLHRYREVSNAVAHQFQVMHQSPQLLIITNGEAAFHTSHGAITEVNLADHI